MSSDQNHAHIPAHQQTSDDGLFAYTSPWTPQLTYSSGHTRAPSTPSTARSSSIATPSSNHNSRPPGFALPHAHVSPPETSRSAILSTASSTPNFAFRPPSEPNSARLSYSRGRTQTRINSSEDTPANTGRPTGISNLESLPETEKLSEQETPPPGSSWPSSQKLDSFPEIELPPISLDRNRLSSRGGDPPKYAEDQRYFNATVHRDENHLYLEEIEEDSPYPEVRASVSNADDPDMPCLTFRMWTIGLPLCLMINAVNMYLYLRYPAPTMSGPFAAVISYVAGKIFAAVLPIRSWNIAGYEFSLNPGPFNVKEHTLICMLAGITTSNAPYSIGAVITLEKRYMQSLRTGFSFLFVLSSHLLGLGLAGFCRRLFVYPAFAIWPSNLSITAMLNALHAENDTRPGISRLQLFLWATVGSCFWVFVPGYLFTGLSYFSFLCWIWPKNVVVNQVFGSVTGLGLNFLTFDWSQISWIGSPLVWPFWAQLHMFVCFAIVYWIIAPILYYSNVWKSGHLPIMGSSAFDRFAKPYNLTRVFDPHTSRFNLTAYEEYSPLYLPISFTLTYILGFAYPPALVVQTILHYWPAIHRTVWSNQKKAEDKEDIHAKLMRRYPEVPLWCFLAISMSCLALATGLAFIQLDVGVPLSAIALSITLALVFIIPQCYIDALSGQTAAINVVVQIIPGTLWPEKPITNIVFKTYTLSTVQLASNFVMTFKLAHYMKVPPRYTFLTLVVAQIFSTVAQLAVKEWIFATVQDVCMPGQAAELICANSQVWYTASIIWGLIGPKRQFGKGAVYYGPGYAAIAGAMLPLVVWWWNRRYRGPAWLKSFNPVVALGGPLYIPPATGINYSSWFVVGVIFQYYIRTRRYRWWSRYNFVLAAALNSGTSAGVLLCFLVLQLPKRGTLSLNWWGNTVWQNTADAEGTPFYPTDPVLGF